MQIESERKFLVVKAPLGSLRKKRGIEILQGYLCDNPPFRIRIEGEKTLKPKCFLTIKKKLIPGCNLEFEDEISQELAERLLGLAKNNLVRKTRFNVAGLELDVFSHKLEGLVLLEVEYGKFLKAGGIHLPSGFELVEVTGDERFENHNLAKIDSLPEDWRCRDVSRSI